MSWDEGTEICSFDTVQCVFMIKVEGHICNPYHQAVLIFFLLAESLAMLAAWLGDFLSVHTHLLSQTEISQQILDGLS